jgi:hypothetical protein
MVWIFHSDYRLNPAKSFEQPFNLGLLEFKLVAVAQVLQLTATAFFIDRATAVFYVFLAVTHFSPHKILSNNRKAA